MSGGRPLNLKRKPSTYAWHLPKPIKAGLRCQVLNVEGQRCRKMAKLENSFHGEPEFDNVELDGMQTPSWIAYYTCGGDHRVGWEK